MEIRKKRLLIAFLLTLILTLFVPKFFPSLRLTFFAPFLVIVFYQKSYLFSLWIAAFSGLLLDFLSPFDHLGIHAINYCLTTVILYRQTRNFFADNLTTIPLMTYLFSLVSTLIQLFLLAIFERGVPLSPGWFLTDLAILPVIDAFFGFLLFTLPSLMRRPQAKRY